MNFRAPASHPLNSRLTHMAVCLALPNKVLAIPIIVVVMPGAPWCPDHTEHKVCSIALRIPCVSGAALLIRIEADCSFDLATLVQHIDLKRIHAHWL